MLMDKEASLEDTFESKDTILSDTSIYNSQELYGAWFWCVAKLPVINPPMVKPFRLEYMAKRAGGGGGGVVATPL